MHQLQAAVRENRAVDRAINQNSIRITNHTE
jgi:hypothetical protein